MRFKIPAKILSVILSLCFVFTSGISSISVLGDNTQALKDKKAKIQQEIEDAQEEIDKLKEKKTETQETITALDKKISLLQDQIDALQEDADKLQREIEKTEQNISDTEGEIKDAQKRINKKQKEFDQIFADYCQRLRAMYVSGNASNLEVLLTSTDISSILTRSQMIKSVSEQDSQTLDTLMGKMEEIEQEKAELEKKRNQLKQDKEQLEIDKQALEDNISDIKDAKRELDDEVDECNALIRKLADETAEYQETIEDNEEEIKEIQRQIDAAYARASHGTGTIDGSTGDGSHSGTLGYPTYSRDVSAGYPNYSSGRYHGGVDFRCPSGTAVCAAESGTVIVALNLEYSYGHYIIIDHGNGLSTLYAHNTTLLVSVGDHVSRGQQIAYSGSTGNSTGPHCHFEVRVNGTRVNPWNYL